MLQVPPNPQTLEQISIREITDAAGLSYPTFFRRFASKEELIEDIATAEVSRLMAAGGPVGTRADAERGAAGLCGSVQTHRRLWTTLLNGGASTAMRREFMRIAHLTAERGPRVNPWMPVDLAVPFVTSGVFELFAWWLRQPEDYPIENVLKLFNALITDSVSSRRDIGLV